MLLDKVPKKMLFGKDKLIQENAYLSMSIVKGNLGLETSPNTRRALLKCLKCNWNQGGWVFLLLNAEF